ncbi:transcription initiation factor TFIID subunit 11 [Pancytospora philotis]|nr:transcription initiation factor TFIID subunit 11 [Pancytospora philotis]
MGEASEAKKATKEKEKKEDKEKEADKDKDEQNESESSVENDSLYSQESAYRQKNDPYLRAQLARMGAEDLERYKTFRRCHLPKTVIKKFINSVIGQAVNQNMVIGVCGLCKVFVGELVCEAKKVQEEGGECGPLLPSHIHEAYRRVYKRVPNLQVRKREPWNI